MKFRKVVMKCTEEEATIALRKLGIVYNSPGNPDILYLLSHEGDCVCWRHGRSHVDLLENVVKLLVEAVRVIERDRRRV